jgi:hypothetical protein
MSRWCFAELTKTTRDMGYDDRRIGFITVRGDNYGSLFGRGRWSRYWHAPIAEELWDRRVVHTREAVPNREDVVSKSNPGNRSHVDEVHDR